MDKLVPISFRLTPRESEILAGQMEASNAQSKTKFIKDRIFGVRESSGPEELLIKLADLVSQQSERMSKIEAHLEELTDTLKRLVEEDD